MLVSSKAVSRSFPLALVLAGCSGSSSSKGSVADASMSDGPAVVGPSGDSPATVECEARYGGLQGNACAPDGAVTILNQPATYVGDAGCVVIPVTGAGGVCQWYPAEQDAAASCVPLDGSANSLGGPCDNYCSGESMPDYCYPPAPADDASAGHELVYTCPYVHVPFARDGSVPPVPQLTGPAPGCVQAEPPTYASGSPAIADAGPYLSALVFWCCPPSVGTP